jgi:phosphotriesterase-related protein
MTMRQVQTVAGPLAPDMLGKVLIHEHFLIGHPGWEGDQTVARFDWEQVVQAGVRMAEKVRSHGVQTVLDATPNDLGRNVEILREIAERSGVNIICASGYFSETQGGSCYFRTLSQFADGASLVYELIKREVTEGIRDTGIRPGVIKIATGEGAITDYERMFFKVAARVSKEDGVPITTHTERGTVGPEQAALLLSEGADPEHVLIGHSCGNTEMDYLLRILEKGVYIGFDRFGIEGVMGTPTDAERIRSLLGLIERGYANRIMISHDWINFWLARPLVNDIVAMVLPKWNAGHFFEDVLPELRAAGVSEEQITTMLVDNPRRFLAGA